MEYYQIRIAGHLDQCWSEEFGGLELTWREDGTTSLEGLLPDQGALFGILVRIRDLNLQLLSAQLTTHRGKTGDTGGGHMEGSEGGRHKE